LPSAGYLQHRCDGVQTLRPQRPLRYFIGKVEIGQVEKFGRACVSWSGGCALKQAALVGLPAEF